ncbi:protein GRAVITROPIC IN THE LIGHT 1-like [Gastrolobium bilobum]|uniref:protein GRAVITROPIC IN THE LIGHT 1-like n=1 Tax=Gastrolobium bilobum TaxID=150636 RepID=UPI002AB032A8|nr:protein GRAVITROPIC IN THE LIGHT 1-like [Gastrolobium bilobum]
METIKPKSAINSKSNKLAKTFQKVISFRAATKIALNNGMCILTSQSRVKQHLLTDRLKTHKGNRKHEDIKARNRAVMEALIAKLFAGVSTIKAAYAELQMAQHPYNNEAIQKADQAVVDELRAISELKLSFLQKELKLSPQVTLMLAEIQEQQSLMKTYEIIIKKLEAQVHVKEAEHSSLKKHIDECIPYNKSLEKKLNSSGSLSMLENLQLSVLSPSHFVQFLHRTLRSIRSFVKLMICEMESAHWDHEAAVRFIHPDAVFATPNHQYLAFESFVCITMFEGFNYPNFTVPSQSLEKPHHHHSQQLYFDKFKKLKSLNLKHYLAQGPNSSLARFLKSKYLQVIHAKMECSLFGNLNQRKLLNNGGVPDSEFFMAFAEMAKRVWALHCLAFSFEEEVTIFQVKKNTRFSEVYMECAAEQQLLSTSGEAADFNSGELRVGFTVVPGFKIGKTVIQSQVYMSPVGSPASC